MTRVTGLFLAVLLFICPCWADLTPSAPITINGKSDQVIQNLKITSTAGDCVSIINSQNITLQYSEIGPCGGNGVKIVDGNGIHILDSYIHPETLSSGCCDHNDGVFATKTSNLLIQGDVIAFGESNIEVQKSDHVQVIGNFLLNPRDNRPDTIARGQNFQCWNGCSQVTVENNYALESPRYPFYNAQGESDDINFGITEGAVAKNNFVHGLLGNSSCGLIADKKADDIQFIGNRLLDTGQCGIGISDGSHQLVDSNKVLNRTPNPKGGNTAIFVWQPPGHAGDACGPVTVTNNIATAYKPNGTQSGFWKGKGCDPLISTNNIFNATAEKLLTPVDQVFQPPLIPPQPHACVVISPYSNQISAPRCEATSK